MVTKQVRAFNIKSELWELGFELPFLLLELEQQVDG